MREIKFRVWDKICDRFFNDEYNYPVAITNKGKIGILVDDVTFEEYKENELKKIVISYYTGLEDRNGKEIYEGDIVKIDRQLFIVSYMEEKASYMLDEVDSYMSDYLSNYDINKLEIIGNIYENSELLGDE